ncbi:MAG: FAD-dependent oxidoreductase [Clostridiaceae bacterium]
MYDVAIIGAGIIGAFCARTLSKYDIKICVIEKENDCSMGTTKANSAIVHGGFDPEPGSFMAKTNVLGNRMYEDISRELNVPFVRNGALVVAYDEADIKVLQHLLENGKKNGVDDLRLLNAKEVMNLVPRISNEVIAALHCPSSGITSPFEMTSALMENAALNGCKIYYDFNVTDIKKNKIEQIHESSGYFTITSEVSNGSSEKVDARYIINATGVDSDKVFELIGEKEYTIQGYRGQYYVTDKTENHGIELTLFKTPDMNGKGVLIAPMVHGNLLLGPNSEMTEFKHDLGTSRRESEFITERVKRFVPDINIRSSIRSFSGVRAYSDKDDFIIEESKSVKGFINLAGIKSPGLTAAPAIALMAKDILEDAGLKFVEKEDYEPGRKGIGFLNLSKAEQDKLIQADPSYGRIICRCEMVTEGEIREALRRPNPPKTLDGVKRRVRPGSGRCQGGFCGPRVLEILADHYGVSEKEILQDKKGSFIITEGMEDRDGKL